MKTSYRVRTVLPRSFPRNTRGLVAHGDLQIRGGGKLRAKVVVFKTVADLRRFWRKGLRLGAITHALGAVNDLSRQRQTIAKDGSVESEQIQFDRKYFCIIGLCRRHCGMTVLSHESVHAGFAHARRKCRSAWQEEALRLDEEAVAYPAGEIARGLVMFLEKAGVYDRVPVLQRTKKPSRCK